MMTKRSEVIQSSDWKSERHVPLIECPEQVHCNIHGVWQSSKEIKVG